MGTVPPPPLPPLPPLLLLLLLAPALLHGAAEHAEVLCAGTACYTLHRGKLAWGNAQKKCQDNGGNLAAIRSPEEARLVQELLGRSAAGAGGQGNVWIGLSLEKGKCVQAHDPLRGFSWAGGSGEAGNYSAWLAEPHTTCLSHRCGSLQPAGPSGAGGWADRPCRSPLPGYVCKFSFQGMCGPLALAGPGTVRYSTPFGVESGALPAAPFGTLAHVACGAGGRPPQFVLCKERRPAGGFAWHQRGPLCAVSCALHNGGCAQRCLEDGAGAPPRCACHPGFVLAPDLVACVPDDVCEPNPCEGTCRRGPDGGVECGCSPGFALAPDGRRCLDVDECLGRPCQRECREAGSSTRCGHAGDCADGSATCPELCINVPGSFRCACPPGFSMAPGGTSCLPEPPATNGTRGPASDTVTLQPMDSSAQPTFTTTSTTTSTSSSISSTTISTIASSAMPSSTRATSTTSISTSTSTASTSTTVGPRPALDAEHAADGPKLLLYYILGSLVAILLLVAFALALLAYRRRKAKEEKRQAKSAADDYCWVPEQAEGTGAGGGFR